MKKATSSEWTDTFPRAVLKMIESAFSTLHSVDIDLALSPRTRSDIEDAIKSYYRENPSSRVSARNLVGVLVFMVSHRNNEFISLSAISDAIGVKPGSLTRYKRRVKPILRQLDRRI